MILVWFDEESICPTGPPQLVLIQGFAHLHKKFWRHPWAFIQIFAKKLHAHPGVHSSPAPDLKNERVYVIMWQSPILMHANAVLQPDLAGSDPLS